MDIINTLIVITDEGVHFACIYYLHLFHPVIGTLAGEHLPHHDAHRVDVGALVVLVARQHLGGHPMDRAHVRSEHGVVVPQPGQAEVTDLHVEGLI